MEKKRELSYIDTGEIVTEDEVVNRRLDIKQRKKENQMRGYANKKSKDDLHSFIDIEFGRFYFMRYTSLLNQLHNDSASVFRYLYLCTYADYDGILMYGCKTYNKHNDYMTDKDLKDVLKLTQPTVYKLICKLKAANLLQYIDNKIQINTNITFRGKANKTIHNQIFRLFDKNIQELYLNTKPKKHKLVGLIFMLLPHVNHKYNVLCHNITESDPNYINPLTATDITKICGYDQSQCNRLVNNLFALNISNEFVLLKTRKYQYDAYYINPRIYYAGSNIQDMEMLLAMFHIGDKI